jgi:hypothetical protein
MTLYPDGYGTRLVTLEQLRAIHEPKQHPEFARRFFAYIVSEGGRLGVGGGWRSTQPNRPGFAPDGESFHQDQRFASGFVGYAAVDLVVPVPGGRHRAPTWGEVANAPTFGLHTFITKPPEPWHIQCIEMRGWQSWVDAGRPDPAPFALPGDKPPPPTTEDPATMLYIAVPKYAGVTADTPWLAVFESGNVRRAVNSDVRYAQTNGVALIDQDSKEQHDYLIAKFGV